MYDCYLESNSLTPYICKLLLIIVFYHVLYKRKFSSGKIFAKAHLNEYNYRQVIFSDKFLLQWMEKL